MATMPELSAEQQQRLRELEDSYLSYDDPLRQSGYHGGPSNWRKNAALCWKRSIATAASWIWAARMATCLNA